MFSLFGSICIDSVFPSADLGKRSASSGRDSEFAVVIILLEILEGAAVVVVVVLMTS
jgi:hypothetical protein